MRVVTWIVVVIALGGVVTWRLTAQQPYASDTVLYAIRALEFTGKSPTQAREEVARFYTKRHLVADANDTSHDLLFKPRILYPLASAPFVAAFGLPGLLVLPVLGFAVAIIGIAVLGQRMFGVPGLLAPLLFLASTTMTSWPLMALTEGLTLAFIVGILLLLPWHGDGGSRRSLAGVAALLIALSLTRQATLVPAVMLGALWVASAVRERRAWTAWLPYAMVSLAVTAGLILYVQIYAGFGVTDNWKLDLGTRSTSASLHHLPGAVTRALREDLNSLQGTSVLSIVVLLALSYVLLKRGRSPLAVALCGAVIGNLLLFVANPYPTYLRTWMLVMPLAVLAAAGTLSVVHSRVRRTSLGPFSGSPRIAKALPRRPQETVEPALETANSGSTDGGSHPNAT